MKKKNLFASLVLGIGLIIGGLSIGTATTKYVEANAAAGDLVTSWRVPTSKPTDGPTSKAAFTNGWTASSHGKSAWYADCSYKMNDVGSPNITSSDISAKNLKDITVAVRAKAGGSGEKSPLKVTTYGTNNKEISSQLVDLTGSYPSTWPSVDFHEASVIKNVKFAMGSKISGSNIYFGGVDIKEGSAKVNPTGITLDNSTLSIQEFLSGKLTATLIPTGADGTVEWTSSTPSVATVEQDGTIKALTQGQTTITAKVAGTTFTAKCVVTVTENQAQRYSLVKSAADLNVGGEYIITNVDKTFALSAFDKAYATLSEILNSGDEVIEKTSGAQILTLGGQAGAYTLYNKSTSQYLMSSCSKTENELLGSAELVDGAYWSIGEFTPKSSVTIKANTTVTGARNIIRYNSTSSRFACYGSGQNDILLFKKVTPAVASVAITETSQTLDAGDTLQLHATVLPADSLQSVIWTSDNPTAVEVNKDTGLVTALKAGTATIKAVSPENNAKYAEITITVESNSIVSIACVNPNDLLQQYIGLPFDPTGLKFESTRQDTLHYPIDPNDISFELYQGNVKQADLVVTETTTSAVATLKGTSFTYEILFTPVVNKIHEFNKVTDVAQIGVGSQVIITNNATEVKALSTKQTSYNRSTTLAEVSADKISIKHTDLKTTPIAIFDVEKGIAENTLAFYDGRCSTGQGYLGFQHSTKGDHYNVKTYMRLEDTNRDWTVTMHTDNTISMKAVYETTTGFLNVGVKETAAGAAISADATTHVNIYVYNPTIEEKLLAWGHNHMMMDDVDFKGDGTGDCLKLYKNVKKVLNNLGSDVIAALKDAKDGELLAIKNRFDAWAKANKDATPYDGLAFVPAGLATVLDYNVNATTIIIVSISVLSVACIALLIAYRRKQQVK